MTFLNEILGTALMGVVSGRSAAELGHMDRTLRLNRARKFWVLGRK